MVMDRISCLLTVQYLSSCMWLSPFAAHKISWQDTKSSLFSPTETKIGQPESHMFTWVALISSSLPTCVDSLSCDLMSTALKEYVICLNIQTLLLSGTTIHHNCQRFCRRVMTLRHGIMLHGGLRNATAKHRNWSVYRGAGMCIMKDLYLLTKLQVAVYLLYNKAWVREPWTLLT